VLGVKLPLTSIHSLGTKLVDSYSVPLVLLDVVLGEAMKILLRYQMARLWFIQFRLGLSVFAARSLDISILAVILPAPPTFVRIYQLLFNRRCVEVEQLLSSHLNEAFISFLQSLKLYKGPCGLASYRGKKYGNYWEGFS
jgi:hypothetical protein